MDGQAYFSGQNLLGLEELEKSEYVPMMRKKVNPEQVTPQKAKKVTGKMQV